MIDIKEIVKKQRAYSYAEETMNIDFRLNALKKLKESIQKHEQTKSISVSSMVITLVEIPTFQKSLTKSILIG